MARAKYRNKRVTIDGIVFDSKKEASRYKQLVKREQDGEISNLQRQVKFTLIPAQYEFTAQHKLDPKGEQISFIMTLDKFEFVKDSFKKVKKRCIEREVCYIADFVYQENGKTIVEDTKGYRTTDYILKRKMLLFFRNIKIKEI